MTVSVWSFDVEAPAFVEDPWRWGISDGAGEVLSGVTADDPTALLARVVAGHNDARPAARVTFSFLSAELVPLVDGFLADRGLHRTDGEVSVWAGDVLDDEGCRALALLGPMAFTAECSPGDGLIALLVATAPGLFWTGTADAAGSPVLTTDGWEEVRGGADWAHDVTAMVATVNDRFGLDALAEVHAWHDALIVDAPPVEGEGLAVAAARVTLDGRSGSVQTAVRGGEPLAWRTPLQGVPSTGRLVLVTGRCWSALVIDDDWDAPLAGFRVPVRVADSGAVQDYVPHGDADTVMFAEWFPEDVG